MGDAIYIKSGCRAACPNPDIASSVAKVVPPANMLVAVVEVAINAAAVAVVVATIFPEASVESRPME